MEKENQQLQLHEPLILQQSVSRADIDIVITSVAEANGMSDHLDRLKRQCETESSYNVNAYNKGSDCRGLFQLAGPTAREFNVNRNDWRDNIVGGVKYMRWLLNYYKSDYAKALAGFNWGLGHVNKAVKDLGPQWQTALPAETKKYLEKIL